MNESCHTYAWLTSQIWMRHVTHMHTSCCTYERVTSRKCISHITRMNETCRRYKWGMSCIWIVMSHIHTGIRTSSARAGSNVEYARRETTCYCPFPAKVSRVVSHIWMSHVTHMHEPCHSYAWVMSHTWMGYVTHTDEVWHTYAFIYEWIDVSLQFSQLTCYCHFPHKLFWFMSHIRMGLVTHE